MSTWMLLKTVPFAIILIVLWLVLSTTHRGSITSFNGWDSTTTNDGSKFEDTPEFYDDHKVVDVPKFENTHKFEDVPKYGNGPKVEDASKVQDVTDVEDTVDDDLVINEKTGQTSGKTWNAAEFKKAWLEADGKDFYQNRISEVCRKATWRKDVVLHMQQSRGGLGNVRATILEFFHAAILVGANVILPSYAMRRPKNETDAGLGFTDNDIGFHDFSHYFDKDWLLETMGEHCPQLKIYQTVEEASVTSNISDIYTWANARSDKDPKNTEAVLKEQFKKWLTSQKAYTPGSRTLVPVTATLLNFDIHSRPKLRTALGRLLRINPDVRGLAGEVVWAMRERYNLKETLDPRDLVPRNSYCGVHLRTEDDAIRAGWTNIYTFDQQTDIFIEMCGRLGFRVIYVASGLQADVVRFAEKARASSLTVLGKHDLLSSPAQEMALTLLSWDQQGALDYEVLARSSYFMGPSVSSFTWSLAIRRYFNNVDVGRGSLKWVNPYAVQEDEPHVTYDDGISRVILRPSEIDYLQDFSPKGMFP
ncbi:alternative oxidase [Colletotrichum truncatum]|uniref:Alternative oxidase n=1 Tax=Colletotrichum truncatum TaxID=5467 RepID=A0ACC3Z087_COLTU|nr:alternative oxidase [Colletotrichum truncatum]KAF6800723.1 alternative oxidase [Colletotrichum truncatum]